VAGPARAVRRRAACHVVRATDRGRAPRAAGAARVSELAAAGAARVSPPFSFPGAPGEPGAQSAGCFSGGRGLLFNSVGACVRSGTARGLGWLSGRPKVPANLYYRCCENQKTFFHASYSKTDTFLKFQGLAQ